MNCAHCGSPLKVEDGKAYAECKYCGGSTRVRGAKTLLAEGGSSPQPVPAPVPTPRPYRHPPAPAPKSGSSCAFVFVALVFLSGVVPFLVMSTGVDMASFFEGASPRVAATIVVDSPETQSLAGRADGTVAASSQAMPGCSGYITEQPFARVVTPMPGLVHFNVDGTDDLTLTIRTSDGRWLCDDDSGDSLLPQLAEWLPSGTHEVWVGRFLTTEESDFRLLVTEDLPGMSMPDDTFDSKPDEEPHETQRRRRRRRHSMRPSRMASHMNAAQETPTLDVNMDPAPQATATRGLLTVITVPWSNVRVDGRVLGHSPVQNIIAPVGRVTVEVQREGEGEWTRLNANVHADHPTTLRYTFH